MNRRIRAGIMRLFSVTVFLTGLMVSRSSGAERAVKPEPSECSYEMQAGFKWGGEIAGKQKDFMHFSLTGY